MDVSVLIVNYNTADLISACIDSVLKQKNCSIEVIVVDNASKDNSVEVLEKYNTKIRLIKNNANLGFGKANNLGFRKASGKYIFLLNPDAVLIENNITEELVKFIEKNKAYGIIGPKVIKDNKVTQPQKVYPGEKYLQNPLKKLPGKIAWIIGACMLIRKEVYENINGFDEDYFLYGEEADLCLRARKAGWEIGYAENITVGHIGAASERSSSIKDYWQRKQLAAVLFYRKNYGSEEATRLIKREIKLIKRKLFFLKFIRNPKKQERYEAVLETLLRATFFA